MSVSSVALVAQVYVDAGSGNWDAVEAVMSDDLVIHEPKSLPFGGDHHGCGALRRLFAIVMANWIDPDVKIDRIVGDDSHVVALLRFTMTSRHTGRRFSQPVAEVSKISEGRIAEMWIHYFDSTEIALEAGGG